jgi:CDP-6-deoxy-D-xylo-4-hexulose-3-dehydrase
MKTLDKKSKVWRPIEHKKSFTASFCYPMIFTTKEDKDKAVKALIDNGVETRPLICGSMGTQPFFIKRYGRHETTNSAIIDSCGIYVPNHPQLSKDDVEFICKTVIEAIK